MPSVLVCATQLAAQCARALCLTPQVLESRRRLERLQTAQRAAATGGTHTLNHWGTLIPNPTTAALETERRYARGAMFAMNPFERR